MSDGVRIATIAERLNYVMSLKGIKQSDLVAATGINKSAMSSYVNGKYEPKSDAVYRLAVALDVSEMWLWGYDVPMERPLDDQPPGHTSITKEDIKFALFGGAKDITDEMYEEVLKFAEFVKHKYAKKDE